MNLNDALWTISPGNKPFYFDTITVEYAKRSQRGDIIENGLSCELDGRILYEVVRKNIKDTAQNISYAVTDEMSYPYENQRFNSINQYSPLLEEEVISIIIFPPNNEKTEMCVTLEGYEDPVLNYMLDYINKKGSKTI